MWVFPSLVRFQSPLKPVEIKHGTRVFDYENGTIRTVDELKELYGWSSAAFNSVTRARELLSRANSDMRHPKRRDLAIWASKSFFWLFLANTGMNFSVAADIPWDPSYEVSSSRQGFRALKFRSQGQEINVEIGSKFLPVFKKYLNLRAYLLNGREFHRLFFDVSFKSREPIAEIRYPLLKSLRDFYKSIDPEFELVLSREWRQAKSDFSIREGGISAAAAMLQNTEKTVRKNYTGGSEESWKLEWQEFFSLMGPAIMVHADRYKSEESTISHCSSFGDPVPAPGTVDAPNCETGHGCLSCSKYRVHAHEGDVRKLCSAKLFITEVSVLNPSPEFFEENYKAPLEKIEHILKEIASISEGHKLMVDSIQSQIKRFECLDPYWELKLSMLYELGVLNG